MIGIIVPAHDEETTIAACASAAVRAGQHPALGGEEVAVVVALDACEDRTGPLARSHGARTVELHARNVGLARQAGAQAALAVHARWLAFTDADSVVADDWLVAQLAQQADAVCGTVEVTHWGEYGERMRRHFERTYRDCEGHSHVHGANFGVSASAYLAAGGFAALETGEDVALVEALRQSGARIAWSSAPRVTTSARSTFKAPKGFGAHLARVEQLRQWVGLEAGPVVIAAAA